MSIEAEMENEDLDVYYVPSDIQTKSSICKQYAIEQGVPIIDLPLSTCEVDDLKGWPTLKS